MIACTHCHAVMLLWAAAHASPVAGGARLWTLPELLKDGAGYVIDCRGIQESPGAPTPRAPNEPVGTTFQVKETLAGPHEKHVTLARGIGECPGDRAVVLLSSSSPSHVALGLAPDGDIERGLLRFPPGTSPGFASLEMLRAMARGESFPVRMHGGLVLRGQDGHPFLSSREIGLEAVLAPGEGRPKDLVMDGIAFPSPASSHPSQEVSFGATAEVEVRFQHYRNHGFTLAGTVQGLDARGFVVQWTVTSPAAPTAEELDAILAGEHLARTLLVTTAQASWTMAIEPLLALGDASTQTFSSGYRATRDGYMFVFGDRSLEVHGADPDWVQRTSNAGRLFQRAAEAPVRCTLHSGKSAPEPCTITIAP